MAKILIIPDVHNRCSDVESIIKRVAHDEVTFLGDYFDDFGDDPNVIRDVADWFKFSVNQKNRTHLCGNHDVHYWFAQNKTTRCSGYDYAKSIAISDILTTRDWEKLKFFSVIDDKWLLSHAGIHPDWITSKEIPTLTSVKQNLEHESVLAIKKFYNNDGHWFGEAGYGRSYRARNAGGLLWCDWNDEFMPIRGIHQIVGHTPQFNPNWKIIESDTSYKRQFVSPMESDKNVRNVVLNDELKNDNSYNICLDSQPGSQYYAIYENGKLTVHNVNDIDNRQ